MTIIIRHDIDNAFNVHLLNYVHFKFPQLFHLPYYLENEGLMVHLEKRFGLKATYFFRVQYTPPSTQLLHEMNENSFEVGLHIDNADVMEARKLLERICRRQVFGASIHGSSFGILAPGIDSYVKSIEWTEDRIREAGLEYIDGAGRLKNGEIITVDKPLRLGSPLKPLFDLILKNADDGFLKLLIHPTYLRGYGLSGGYGLYPPAIAGVQEVFQYIHDNRIKTYTYHEYVKMVSK
jgi:hypothetical protein